MKTINIYGDESCHLENDNIKVMVLGAIWCPMEKKDDISKSIREIKRRNGVSPTMEVKWTKVAKTKKELYVDLVNYFFDEEDLHFRGLVVPNKKLLDHIEFSQDHDTWYYKMYFSMLKVIIDPHAINRIFIDVKDSRSGEKTKKLHTVLCNEKYDFNKEIIQTIQIVRSHEVEILQLTDLLIGAIGYVNRELNTNEGKVAVVEQIRKRSGYNLTRSTFLKEDKFNLFIWQPRRRF